MTTNAPIGVFDSGIGGLTVLAALLERFPHEDFVYLGDTARVPYGTRHADTIRRYAVNNTRTLEQRTPLKALVVACNTASAVSIELLRSEFDFPVLGVIEPGARAALGASKGTGIHVLGTRGTVRSQAYPSALKAHGYTGDVTQTACPLLVGLVEEGWTNTPVTKLIVEEYIQNVPKSSDVVILGCTHFPLLRGVVEKALPSHLVVDAGRVLADDVEKVLGTKSLRTEGTGTLEVLVTDDAEHTHRMAERFLGRSIDSLSLVELKMS